mmetsp:Transcript_7352/g.16059  ORF Transcript_7352/g.16059 Transcript_7352/m.16059 type:complete len:375 (-) Transcript_7352:156-1280(-)
MLLTRVVKVLVDFVILLNNGEVPTASTNVGGFDRETGFYMKCHSECPLTSTQNHDGSTSPRMKFCECVAKLMVEDLSADFGALNAGLEFELGSYRTAEEPAVQSSVILSGGHALLKKLMNSPPAGAARAEQRITVWVAGELPARSGRQLEGSTYLNQPLYKNQPGAGVLLLSQVARQGHRLSHETGHIIGFHHTAGETGLDYTYDECGQDVEWFTLSRPTCEMNIMGSWYDGPVCCPDGSSSSSTCTPYSQGSSQAYCCGDSCEHNCPETHPAMKFNTAEHTQVLHDITACWASLIGTQGSSSNHTTSSLLVYHEDLSAGDSLQESRYTEDYTSDEGPGLGELLHAPAQGTDRLRGATARELGHKAMEPTHEHM